MVNEKEKKIIDHYNKEFSKEDRGRCFIKLKKKYSYYKQFLDLLNVEHGNKILDVSCGRGSLLLEAKKRGLLCYGIDISSVAISETKAKIDDAALICKSVEEGLPYEDNFFDYITCIGSLEHFYNQSFILKEISRVAKINSRVCILVPNENYILHKFGYETDHQPIVNRHTLGQYINLIKTNGLSINQILKENEHLGSLYSSTNYFKFMIKLIIHPFVNLLPLRLSYCFIFVCAKTE